MKISLAFLAFWLCVVACKPRTFNSEADPEMAGAPGECNTEWTNWEASVRAQAQYERDLKQIQTNMPKDAELIKAKSDEVETWKKTSEKNLDSYFSCRHKHAVGMSKMILDVIRGGSPKRKISCTDEASLLRLVYNSKGDVSTHPDYMRDPFSSGIRSLPNCTLVSLRCYKDSAVQVKSGNELWSVAKIYGDVSLKTQKVVSFAISSQDLKYLPAENSKDSSCVKKGGAWTERK